MKNNIDSYYFERALPFEFKRLVDAIQLPYVNHGSWIGEHGMEMELSDSLWDFQIGEYSFTIENPDGHRAAIFMSFGKDFENSKDNLGVSILHLSKKGKPERRFHGSFPLENCDEDGIADFVHQSFPIPESMEEAEE